MANFNLEDYEVVQNRIDRFYKDYPDGRIITKLEGESGDVCKFSASLYLNKEDQEKHIAKSCGWAHEVKGNGYVNKTSHFENCETSAIGRALANAGYSGSKNRASREEMEGAIGREEKPKECIQKDTTPNGVYKKVDSKTREQLDGEVREILTAHKVPPETFDKLLADNISPLYTNKNCASIPYAQWLTFVSKLKEIYKAV